MAKYAITRSCGHTEEIQIGGPVAGRERQAEYEATRLCAACYQAQQAAKRATANAAAAQSSQVAGLPALVGTPKQVAWAESIRAAAVASFSDLRMKLNGASAAAEAALAVLEETAGRTSASWWIDNRACPFDARWLASETKRRMGA